MRSTTYLFYCCFLGVAFFSTNKAIAQQQNVTDINSLKFLGQYIVPFNFKYNNTVVGGLSGIDYDIASKLYYIISDDRSDKNPARFYEANIFISEKGIDSLHFVDVKNMLQSSGKVYPNSKQDAYHTPDPEAMRYDPINKHLIWSSEGERIVNTKDTVLEGQYKMSPGPTINGPVVKQTLQQNTIK